MRIKKRAISRACRLILVGALAGLCPAVLGNTQGSDSRPGRKPSGGVEINPDRLLETIRVLASDEFEGRAPATTGEALTTAFLGHSSRNWNSDPVIPTAHTSRRCPWSA